MNFCEVIVIFIFFEFYVSCRDNYTRILNERCFECEPEIGKVHPQSCVVERCDCSKSPRLKFTVNLSDQEEDVTTIKSTKLSPPLDDNLPSPIPHCIETTFIVFRWNTSPVSGVFHYIQYHIDYPGNRIKRIETNLTQCGYITLSDLTPDTPYIIQLIALKVSSDGLSVQYSKPSRLKTRKEHVPPRPVNKFWIDKWIVQDHEYTIRVKWKKARDRSCYYKLTYFQNDEGDYNEMDLSDPLIHNEWNITNLHFGTYYSISITAYTSPDEFPLLESSKEWVNVTTPTCLETFNQIDECVPDMPQNLEVKETPLNDFVNKKSYNITMKWQKPQYAPYYYQVLIELWDINVTLSYNTTGNSTSISISEIELTPKYDVLVIAHSARGPSAPAVIHRQVVSQFTSLEEAEVSDSPVSMYYILTIGCPIILICLAALSGLKLYLAIRLKNKKRDMEVKSSPANNMSKLKIDGWEIDTKKLVIKEILGGGAFGVVRKGFYCREKEEVEVAVKMLRENPTSEEIQQFHHEIQLMKSVPVHPHLVSLIGCVTKEHLLLVVEYCSKGDLQSFLRTASDKILKANLLNQGNDYVERSVFNKMYEFDQLDLDDIPETKDLISFARQVSLGMEYLSSLKLIHRDLATRNVLITENNIAKISDFGLSRDVYYNNMYCKSTGGKLPIRWMALESMTHQFYTTQSDVWSFGILLWEIITMGGTPYPGIPTHDIMGMLKCGYRMKKPENCSNELYLLMCRCWNEQPRNRPSFTEIRETLDEFLVFYSNYVDLDTTTEYKEKGCKLENKKG